MHFMAKHRSIVIIVAIAVVALALFAIVFNDTARRVYEPVLGWVGFGHKEFHIHADFKVFINEKPVDFTAPQYQSTKDAVLDRGVHLHDQDGAVLHMHERGVTLSRTFSSLGMSLANECFGLDTGETFCNDGEKTLRMYVNGKLNKKFGEYVFKDLDKILITYGAEEEAKMQLETITDIACIFSVQCPERGEPPEEGCVTGAGCPIDYTIE
ncbi:MAG: hypothetical protein A3A24_02595 [Candidatus Buchananbacteria bacterium RIFCSPLOWO2_01_FULL_46_12]|uniref:Protein-disulfide isomerase n=2 Tax=Parcubacteria group TaxID=1794811 RepID=A0A1G1YT88_9BACT|nr:MAG: hypothetical protein A3A24_02595 [Candidatus Buchananbacteria bacterium RIFCSPLOWO2_01_FULL_46_12]